MATVSFITQAQGCTARRPASTVLPSTGLTASTTAVPNSLLEPPSLSPQVHQWLPGWRLRRHQGTCCLW